LKKSENISITLNTDKDGKVKLGPLKKIIGIEARSNLYGLEKRWFLNQDSENLTYPATVDTIEGEPIEFPVLFKNKSRKNIALIKKNVNVVLEDYFDKLEFIKQDDKDYNKLSLKNLPDGTYSLNLKKIKKVICITIHRGQYWESDTFILKRNNLFENRAPLKMIKISNINSMTLNFIISLLMYS
jgi:hypothetical protein